MCAEPPTKGTASRLTLRMKFWTGLLDALPSGLVSYDGTHGSEDLRMTVEVMEGEDGTPLTKCYIRRIPA